MRFSSFFLYSALFISSFQGRACESEKERVDRAIRCEKGCLSPYELLSPDRFDLMAKYIYAKIWDWEVESVFGDEIYRRHLEVWNNFYEYFPPKRGYLDFVKAYRALLASIKRTGYRDDLDAIPIGVDGFPCNGGHRITACLFYGREVIAKSSLERCQRYNSSFFRERGLEEKYLDAMAVQYSELQPKAYVMVIFPSAEGREGEVEEIICKYASIAYKKELTLTESGGFNFILTAYEEEPFVREGYNKGYLGAKAKARRCFPPELIGTNPLKSYLLEADSLSQINLCKKEIRALFDRGHDTVHATDNREEAIALARTLFNSNSIDNLNRKIECDTPKFDALFAKYRRWLKECGENQEWFAVDSGAVLAAYGLRDCNDLDFLHCFNRQIASGEEGIDEHNHQAIYHKSPIGELLFNPDNYFFYRGVKFCSLSSIEEMKRRRGEPKDGDDIELINTLYCY